MLFRKSGREGSMVAKIYAQLGDFIKTKDTKKAAKIYRESVGLHKSEVDG
jgi:hypothetical protein